MNDVGIVSYGAHIPRLRIKSADIAKAWGKNPETITSGLGIIEKSVPSIDQDVATISVEAARAALARCNIKPEDIGALYVGSELQIMNLLARQELPLFKLVWPLLNQIW
jgi:hydroxymethylglutaryl-CoA synthase